MNAYELRNLARVWSHPDDWGVPCIYLAQLDRLIDWMELGIPVEAIAAHAGHTGRDCTDICEPMNAARKVMA